MWNNQILNNTKNKKIMNLPTTTTLPIELNVIEEGTFFNIEGNFDAAIIMEDENAKIESIIYIELHEFKHFLSSKNGFDFAEETEEKNEFLAYLFQGSKKETVEGIEFITSDYDIMNFLNDFINSDYNTLSKTVKQ